MSLCKSMYRGFVERLPGAVNRLADEKPSFLAIRLEHSPLQRLRLDKSIRRSKKLGF